jgi:hypothetical protein
VEGPPHMRWVSALRNHSRLTLYAVRCRYAGPNETWRCLPRTAGWTFDNDGGHDLVNEDSGKVTFDLDDKWAAAYHWQDRKAGVDWEVGFLHLRTLKATWYVCEPKPACMHKADPKSTFDWKEAYSSSCWLISEKGIGGC